MERAKPEMKEYLISRGLYKEDRRKQTESLSQIVYELYNWNSRSIKTGERLISEGYDVNERDSDGISPAGWAVIKNNIEALKFFIENKAILNVQDNCGKTPLHFVVETGDKDIMELLLQNGANPNIRDIYGRTPLFYLARKNPYKDENCLKKLIKIMKSYGAK
jgi:ankyrin repeat protein